MHRKETIAAVLLIVAWFSAPCLLGDETNYTYTIIGGEVQIDRYVGTASEVILPTRLEGAPVTRIGHDAFRGLTGVTSVVMHDQIKWLDGGAFAGSGRRRNPADGVACLQVGRTSQSVV